MDHGNPEIYENSENIPDIVLSVWLEKFQTRCNRYERAAHDALDHGKTQTHDAKLRLRAEEIVSLPEMLKVLHEEGVMNVPEHILDGAIAYAEEATTHIQNQDLYGIVTLFISDGAEQDPAPFDKLAEQARKLEEQKTVHRKYDF